MMNWIDRKHLLPSTLALCISFFSTPLSIAQVVSPARSTQAAATPLPSDLLQAIVETTMRRVRAAADQLQFYLNRPRKIDDPHGLGPSSWLMSSCVRRRAPPR